MLNVMIDVEVKLYDFVNNILSKRGGKGVERLLDEVLEYSNTYICNFWDLMDFFQNVLYFIQRMARFTSTQL